MCVCMCLRVCLYLADPKTSIATATIAVDANALPSAYVLLFVCGCLFRCDAHINT